MDNHQRDFRKEEIQKINMRKARNSTQKDCQVRSMKITNTIHYLFKVMHLLGNVIFFYFKKTEF